MGLRVNTNIQSLVAQRHLRLNNEAQKGSLEKLASGTRIARAADDAAGLAISDTMHAQIRSIRQNVRNANDGISMIQTAEGGLAEIGNLLVRFRELSIQAASDTVSDRERGFIHAEVDQLKQEVNRIANSTNFNGRQLLSFDLNAPENIDPETEQPIWDGKLEFQIGPNNVPGQDRFVFDLNKNSASLDAMGLTDISTVTKEQSQSNLEKIDVAIGKLNESRSQLGALQNRLQSGIKNLEIYDENLSAARSRIYDVDVASETAELTRNNILSTAGTAVLSQANQNSMLALKLIG